MSSSRPRGWAFGCLLIALGSLWFAERVSGGKEVSVPLLLGVVGVAALVSSVWVPDAGDPTQPARNEFLSQLGGTAVTAGIVLLVILAFGSLSVGTLQENPTSIKASSISFRRGVGAVRLDLSTLTTASTKEFTASVGVGTVELVLPKSSTTTASVTARTGLGSVVGGDKATIAAGDKYVFGQGPNSISIDLRVGIGTIRILSSP